MSCIFSRKKLALFLFGLLFITCLSFAAEPTAIADSKLEQKIQDLQDQIDDIRYDVFTRDEFGVIISSPYIGLRAAYDTADLITDLPAINTDIVLLEQKRDIAEYAAAHKIKVANRPIVALSGALEADGYFWRDFTGGSSSYIDLGRAELDILADVNPWVMGTIFIVYDNTLDASGPNARVYLDSGFVTLGNLQQSPWYLTAGQVYVPFGQYSHYMVTVPLTRLLMRTRERAAVLGYAKNGVYGTIYGYKGESYTDERSSSINSWGASLGYEGTWRENDFRAYLYYINNIANAEGMQDTYSDYFPGFKVHEHLQHFVPGIGLRGKIIHGPYTLSAEYVGAIRRFDKTYDLSFNDRGAKPQAIDFEANYDFTTRGYLSTFSLGYGKMWESLAFNLPEQSAFMQFSISLFKSTIESIEYLHDWNYHPGDHATGGGTYNVPTVGARTRDILTLQIGVYF